MTRLVAIISAVLLGCTISGCHHHSSHKKHKTEPAPIHHATPRPEKPVQKAKHKAPAKHVKKAPAPVKQAPKKK